MTTFCPESQIDFRNLTTSDERRRLKIGHLENIFGHFENVVAAIANDSTQRGLLDLRQLFRFENARIFIPKSKKPIDYMIQLLYQYSNKNSINLSPSLNRRNCSASKHWNVGPTLAPLTGSSAIPPTQISTLPRQSFTISNESNFN